MPEPFPNPNDTNNSNYNTNNPNISITNEYNSTSTDDLLATLLSTSQQKLNSTSSSRKNSLPSQYNYQSINDPDNSNFLSIPSVSQDLRRSRSLTESIANSVKYVADKTVQQMRRRRFVSSCFTYAW
ncbi:unnamed protein product [Ambrosiozyma monospora]|uniref:Unnamed protein product n=1 Tax=Ambrosiozyma monospora TaxID=43982 RepID=A0ACB5U7E0_AMBMO|nr:unnamed protein product [Ambrosiozyma monospora]